MSVPSTHHPLRIPRVWLVLLLTALLALAIAVAAAGLAAAADRQAPTAAAHESHPAYSGELADRPLV